MSLNFPRVVICALILNFICGTRCSSAEFAETTKIASAAYSEADRICVAEMFDPKYYVSMYGGKLSAEQDPLDHYMSTGWTLGYNPNAWFDGNNYNKIFPCAGNPALDWLSQPVGTTDADYAEQLVVSMTSHPPRIGTAWLSFESILRQTQKANRVVLNLSSDDFPERNIPQSLRILEARGLEIRYSKTNYRVATKLIPSLIDFPEATIITCDDDRCYKTSFINALWSQHMAHPGDIISPAAREYIFDNGNGENYPRIDYLGQKMRYDSAGFGIFEGFCGTLYPPNSLDSEVLNFDNFKLLTPCADDVWFQAMAAKKGTKSRGLDQSIHHIHHWPQEIDGTQDAGLFHEHLNANDWMAYRAYYYYDLLDRIGIPTIDDPQCRACNRKITLTKQGDPIEQALSCNKGKKCKTCLNGSAKKLLCIGAYDYGNIGDKLYKIILNHFLGTDYDTYFAPDTARIGRDGKYISFNSDKTDLDFDYLLIGGGGILKDFTATSSIRYYMQRAKEKNKPYFVMSVGLQTEKTDVNTKEAKALIGSAAELLRKASLLFIRSSTDHRLLLSVLGEDINYKLFAAPDLAYLYPLVLRDVIPAAPEKKYVSLIQTGSANVKMPYVRDRINAALAEHPGSELVIMNWGGVEKPGSVKDFSEWDLFTVDSRREFPNATIYMGDSLSEELKEFRYSNSAIRAADITPLDAAHIVASSHYVMTGRYHGEILAKAFSVPFDPAIFSHKTRAERKSLFDVNRAIDQIDYLKAFIENDGASVMTPDQWSDNQRNSFIVELSKRYADLGIPFLQAMPNVDLYSLRVFGKQYLGKC